MCEGNTVADAPVEPTTVDSKNEATEQTPQQTTSPSEDKPDKIEQDLTSSGILTYKAPGLINFISHKRFFWLGGEEPIHHSNFLSEKTDISHANAAWSTVTGNGLLYFGKSDNSKTTPCGILCLADVTNFVSDSQTEFSFKLNNHKHIFQASNVKERDTWVASISSSVKVANEKKNEIVNSDKYKAALANIDESSRDSHRSNAGKNEALTPKKSSELKRSDGNVSDAAPATEKKSRSVSRGKSGIFGTFKGKKDEKKPVEEATAAETPAAPGEESTEPVPSTASNEKKSDEPIDSHAPEGEPKNVKNKRASLMMGLVGKLRNPRETAVPHVPSKDGDTVRTAPVTEPCESPATSPVKDGNNVATTPAKNKINFFERVMTKKPSKPVTEASPDGTAGGTSTAAGKEEQQSEAVGTDAATGITSTATGAASAAKEKRRTSFFGLTGSSRKGNSENPDDPEKPAKFENPVGERKTVMGLLRSPSRVMSRKDKETKEPLPSTAGSDSKQAEKEPAAANQPSAGDVSDSVAVSQGSETAKPVSTAA